MPNFYEILGVDKNATAAEITAAYNSRMQQLQPNMEDEAKKLKEAFDGLGHEKSRVSYDIRRFGFNSYMQRFRAQGMKVTAIENPYELNHYDYLNQLFGWTEKDKLIPGQKLVFDVLWEKLSYASTMLGHEENAIHAKIEKQEYKEKKTRKNLDDRLKILEENINKIEIILYVLLIPDIKRLYDLTLDIHDGTEELREVGRLIGAVKQESNKQHLVEGRKILAEWFKKQPKLLFGGALFSLQKANLLILANINQLIKHESVGDKLDAIFDDLLQFNLLNQFTFDAVIEKAAYALEIAKGLGYLKVGRVLTLKTFMDMLHTKQDASIVGTSFRTLNEDDLLTEENYAAILKKPPQTANHIHLFNKMWKKKEFLQEDKEAFMWEGAGEVKLLSHRINQMFAHGLTLVDIDITKGKEVIKLAFELKKSIKNFFSQPLKEQITLKHVYRADFIKLLHSKDEEMAKTRDSQYWNIIIKNILIALTGIGLFAIGINYLVNKRLFFSQTQRERNIIAVAKAFNQLNYPLTP